MSRVFVDTEVRLSHSVAFGPHKAVGDGSRLLVVAWQVEGGEPCTWHAGQPAPQRLLGLLADPRVQVVAHNAIFDALVLERRLPGCPPIDRARLDCTAARASAIQLPAGLDAALAALGAPADVRKDTAGAELMLDFAVAVKDRRGSRKLPPLEPEEAPEQFAQVVQYCAQDLRALVWLDARLPALSNFERRVWLAHNAVNARGVLVDGQLAAAMNRVGLAAQQIAEAAFVRETGVPPRSPAKVHAWFASRCAPGSALPEGMGKPTMPAWRKLLAHDPQALEMLRLRSAASNNPGAKALKFVEQACDDGRCRDLFRYAGTATKRWASGSDEDAGESGSNVQNLARGELDPGIVSAARDALLAGADASDVDFICGDVRGALSAMQRSIFVPGEGALYLIEDYAKIEAVVAAVAADHKQRVADIRGNAPLYERAAAETFATPLERVDKAQRQVGKLTELMSQYQGGAARLLQSLQASGAQADLALAERAVAAWRRLNLPIVRLWAELTEGFGRCATTGAAVKVAGGRARFERHPDHLRLVLPSGEHLRYWHPKAVRSYDGRWRLSASRFKHGTAVEAHLHGGVLMENLASGISRDVLADALARCHEQGVAVVLHVHDEIVAEGPASQQPALRQLMRTMPEWGREFALTTAGEAVTRYTK